MKHKFKVSIGLLAFHLLLASLFTPLFGQKGMIPMKLTNGDSISLALSDIRFVQKVDSTCLITYGSPQRTARQYKTTTLFSSLIASSAGGLLPFTVVSGKGTKTTAFNPAWIDRVVKENATQSLILFKYNASSQVLVNSEYQALVQTLSTTGPVRSYKDYTANVSNTSTTETDIFTYTLPENALYSDGEKIIAQYSGICSDTLASARLRAYFGGVLVWDSGTTNISSTTKSWCVRVTIIKTGTTTARASVEVSAPGLATTWWTKIKDLTGLTFTGTNVIKLTATAGGAGGGSSDITGKNGFVQWFCAAP